MGGRLVASDGRTLPLRAETITADTRGGLARVVLVARLGYVEPRDGVET